MTGRELVLVLRENLHKEPSSEVNATVFVVGDLQAEAGEVNRQLVARPEQQPVAEDPLVVAINLRLKDLCLAVARHIAKGANAPVPKQRP